MNLLFVCSENRLRSPTGQTVFADHPSVTALSAGTNHDSDTPVTGDLIEWADVVLFMEKTHKNRVSKRFRDLLHGKRQLVLGIPDNYEYMSPELVQILRRRVTRQLRLQEEW